MKLFRHIATAALITLTAFSAITYTSCSKSEDPANVKYAGKYKGNGTDNTGGTYSNFQLQFTAVSGSSTGMNINVLDNAGASVLQITANLGTGTAYTVTGGSDIDYNYSGTGTVDGSTASLILTEAPKAGGSPTIYTFTSMVKQ